MISIAPCILQYYLGKQHLKRQHLCTFPYAAHILTVNSVDAVLSIEEEIRNLRDVHALVIALGKALDFLICSSNVGPLSMISLITK